MNRSRAAPSPVASDRVRAAVYECVPDPVEQDKVLASVRRALGLKEGGRLVPSPDDVGGVTVLEMWGPPGRGISTAARVAFNAMVRETRKKVAHLYRCQLGWSAGR